MTILHENITLADTTDGHLSSAADTIDATQTMTLTFMGTFARARAQVEVSTYSKTAVDQWVPFGEMVKGPQVFNVTADENSKVRVTLDEVVAASDITIVSGSGNAGA